MKSVLRKKKPKKIKFFRCIGGFKRKKKLGKLKSLFLNGRKFGERRKSEKFVSVAAGGNKKGEKGLFIKCFLFYFFHSSFLKRFSL